MSNLWTTLTALTGIAAATSGGAFVAFSSLVPAGLAKLPDDRGLAAMQRINEAAPRSAAFMTVLFAPAVGSVAVGVRALIGGETSRPALVVAGAAVYLVGVVGMTVAFHVPRNDALVRLDPLRDATAFPRWLRTWVRGNHLRSVSGLVAGMLLVAAVV